MRVLFMYLDVQAEAWSTQERGQRPRGHGEHAIAGATSMRGAGATTTTQRWALSRSGVVRHSANALVAG